MKEKSTWKKEGKEKRKIEKQKKSKAAVRKRKVKKDGNKREDKTSGEQRCKERKAMECGGCNLAKHRDGKIVSTIRASSLPEGVITAAKAGNFGGF